MGGDTAPTMVLDGIGIICEQHPNVRFVLFGDRNRLLPMLAARPKLAACCELRHTDEVVGPEDKPSQIVRRGRNTSMWQCIAMVKDGGADIAISAGNTGALMAMSVLQLRTMEGIDRPAIASTWPSPSKEKVVLDLGANLECNEDNLVQFAVMGAAFARVVLGVSRPRVGLLNVGEEEQKGHEHVRAAAARLRLAPQDAMNFIGFVEGTSLGEDTADVIVSDGFSGNVALKTGEGTAKLIFKVLGEAIGESWLAKLGYLLARRAFNTLRGKFDPRTHNGGVFLGLGGLVIKSHGGTDGFGFAHAISMGIEMARGDLISRINSDLKHFHAALEITAESAPQEKIGGISVEAGVR